MRSPSILLVITVLVCLTGCEHVVSGQAQAAPAPAPGPSLGVVSRSALRFRPVIREAPASATGPSTGAPTQRQSPDKTGQQAALDALYCAHNNSDPLAGKDDPALPLVTCDQTGTTKYILGPAILSGADLATVSVAPVPHSSDFELNLTLRAAGSKTWANWTAAHVNDAMAFVLDAQVLYAPTIDEAIPGGNTTVTGNFTEQEAVRLAHQIAGG
ncbi:MAG TPA: precorrin-3B C(17)-methyltransferase [Pseudonocardiaceae bacterium]|nr:precorrin-3B C(17)-methyltransferase [Pseudonocardiaceae bacterium]